MNKKNFWHFVLGLLACLTCLCMYDLDQTAVQLRCEIPMMSEDARFAAAGYNARGVEMSNETLDLIGQAKSVVDDLKESSKQMPALMTNLNATTVKLPKLVDGVTNTATGATTLLKTTNTAVANSDQQIQDVSGSVQGVLDRMSPLQLAATEMIKADTDFINSPVLIRAIQGIGDVTKSSSVLIAHGDHTFFPIYNGHHRKWHAVGQYGIDVLKSSPYLNAAKNIFTGGY